jgi:NADPH-dependent 2,4-dienoyl-CoA reductase/sulfur reductase-like enzyme
MTVAPNGGFRDPGLNEKLIASGKADMIGMARAFISEPEYSQKAYEGRGEDMVPCIMCNKCHGVSFTGPWFSVCSVNPKLGIPAALKAIDPPVWKKRIAVIGGGPGGMKAALVAAERGHDVTLYEKSDSLGGLLRHSDFSPLKWALKDFKDYLIRQVEKSGIEVVLGKETTPDMIKNKDYDAVMVAIGADPVIPRIPGANGSNVWNVVNVYPNENKLGKTVVVIGGGDIGAETGMFLANAGHEVTALTSDSELMKPGGPHVKEIQIDLYKRMANFSYITRAKTTAISRGKVTYIDDKGKERAVQADSVVIYSGLKPKQDEALKYSGSANRVLFLGDCTGKAGNVQKTIRSAFFVASQI